MRSATASWCSAARSPRCASFDVRGRLGGFTRQPCQYVRQPARDPAGQMDRALLRVPGGDRQREPVLDRIDPSARTQSSPSGAGFAQCTMRTARSAPPRAMSAPQSLRLRPRCSRARQLRLPRPAPAWRARSAGSSCAAASRTSARNRRRHHEALGDVGALLALLAVEVGVHGTKVDADQAVVNADVEDAVGKRLSRSPCRPSSKVVYAKREATRQRIKPKACAPPGSKTPPRNCLRTAHRRRTSRAS